MYSVNLIRRMFQKSPVRVLYAYKRNLADNRSSNRKDLLTDVVTTQTFKIVQNSKLTPKGFEVIYVSPIHRFVKWNYNILFCFWGILFADIYMVLTNDNYMEKLQRKFINVTVRDKICQIVLTTTFILIVHIALSRVVVATFRKGNEFQSLLYGFLGPLTKKYVPHGPRVMEPTIRPGVYDFKGKKVVILSNGFVHLKNFQSVVRLDIE